MTEPDGETTEPAETEHAETEHVVTAQDTTTETVGITPRGKQHK